VKRREFIAFMGGATAAWPLAARAQTPQRVRRIGVFMPGASDPEGMAAVTAFVQSMAQLGWIDGQNVRIDYRWGAGDVERFHVVAAELVALAPDVVLAFGYSTVSALQKTTGRVLIVFAGLTDPVGAGLVASLARPGGNTTGFLTSEFGFAGKWLELLKEVAPRVTRVAVLRDPAVASQIALFGSIQAVAPSLGVELRPIDVRDTGEIERGVTAFAADESNGGLIVPTGARGFLNRELIVALAARHRLPAVYAYRSHVMSGGLISYGSDQVDRFRRAATYVDRILRGEKPADLPVQAPTKYDLVINLKTAKALGLAVPPTLLARADEVIE
jgi:ABC-type uncharacterized transport system substrate-binding protein